ncbi:uncharacterized protein LOC135698604 [Ochlerotatus camptorhynchus]|uniref:uncharacterized protein LOC135698604 n=1 Tax=Ochlerotatus camptorhynchus TaxID=644619 RepID=UPI0031E32EFC
MGKHRSRSPVKEARAYPQRTVKRGRSIEASPIGRNDVTATNVSDIGDFGIADETENASRNAEIVKLPPVVVKNAPLNTLIASFTSMGIKVEFKLSRIGIKVMFRTKAECELATSYLKKSNAEFFTHDIPGEKPFKVVIRGLPSFDPKLIEAENKDRYKLAQLPSKGTVTLNALKAIRSINSIIVRWEPYRGGRHDVTQCQRCLNFGHGTRNCYMKPRCGKCAQNHVSSECDVDES